MNDTPQDWIHYSVSAAQNAAPIFEALLPRLADNTRLFEVGSGTGQHAVHACSSKPNLIWQPSELPGSLPQLLDNLRLYPLAGIESALPCDVLHPPTGLTHYDAVYTANTLHIMSEPAVEALFRFASSVLHSGGFFYSYGPYLFSDRPPVESNLRFDAQLRAQAAHQGVREVEWLQAIARRDSLSLVDTLELPSNNHLLVWEKASAAQP